MPKNVKGGSSHKKQARKTNGSFNPNARKLRLSQEDGEVYA